MEWQQILGFYQVARTGSFTKAAGKVFRTQSALSQQIKALEEEFGCLLFERIGKRKLLLTDAGEKFLAFAEDLVNRHQALTEELDQLKGLQKGSLKIAAPFTTLYHLLPHPLKAYVRAYPLVQLTLLDCPQQRAIEMVRNGEADFGTVLESVVPHDMTSFTWEKVRTALIVPAGHPLSGEKRVTLGQISDYPLILPPRSPDYSNRTRLDDLFRAEGTDLRIVMESSNVELSSLYVELGMGICFAMVAGDRSLAAGRNIEFIPLDHYFEPETVSVIMRKTSVVSPSKKAFLDILLGNRGS
jgi:DNA-binding transcriptional LysR family regulator